MDLNSGLLTPRLARLSHIVTLLLSPMLGLPWGAVPRAEDQKAGTEQGRGLYSSVWSCAMAQGSRI